MSVNKNTTLKCLNPQSELPKLCIAPSVDRQWCPCMATTDGCDISCQITQNSKFKKTIWETPNMPSFR